MQRVMVNGICDCNHHADLTMCGKVRSVRTHTQRSVTMAGETVGNFSAIFTGPKPESLWSDLQCFGTVGTLESGHFSVECGHLRGGRLDLATLAKDWHNVEAACRKYKRITSIPTSCTTELSVYPTVYLTFTECHNLITVSVAWPF